jgi:ABC-type branched-subunit amino acid transport system ATPase component
MTPILEALGINMQFGGLVALDHVDIRVELGAIHAIIGPNGAGKTTLVNVCTGVLRPSSGRVIISDRDVTSKLPNEISHAGVGRTFQTLQLFPDATVLENVMVGAGTRDRRGLLQTLMGTPGARESASRARAAAFRWLEFVRLQERAFDRAGTLPYGNQRLLDMARALATRPRILFLDEPGAGLNDEELEELGGLLDKIRDAGIAIVLIEHNMSFVMAKADRISVLNFGKRIAEGTPEEVSRDPDVVEAYLGVAEDEQ